MRISASFALYSSLDYGGIASVDHKEDLKRTENMNGVKIVDFYVLPHYNYNSSHFSKRTKENVLEATKDIKNKIYALDDNSAIEVIDDNIKIISEGEFLEIN